MQRSIILSVLVLFGLSACSEQTIESQTKELIRPVYATQVNSEEEYSVRRFPGRAQAANAVTLAFEVAGKLIEVPVAVGDKVQQGDVLAILDPRDFQNTLAQAKVELKRAQAQFRRMQKAAQDNAISKQQLTDAEAAFESAKALVKIRKKALDDTKLLAPYDATIAAKFIKNFSNVQAKQAAVRLVNSSQIEIIVDIPEDIISLAEEGMKILVEFDAFPGVIVTSTISEIGTEASQVSRTFPVTLIMDQPDGVTILSGMAAEAWRAPETTPIGSPESKTAGLRGFKVPLSAIFSANDGETSVWVIDTSGKVKRVPVQTGELTEQGVLVKGLQGGEMIATAGVNRLVEGQQVSILTLDQ